MFLHADEGSAAINYKVIDVETGQEIKGVKWANNETGEYGQIRSDENGNWVLVDNDFSPGGEHVIVDSKKGKIKLVWCGEGEEPPRKEV